MANATHNVRRATPVDAGAISELYRRIYTPVGGGDARDCYPFPQIMNPDCVAAMIAAGDVLWLLGEAADGVFVGATAAVRNIGDTRDRISEVFGVVVDAERRVSGLGSALVNALVDELSSTAEFILCEARTHEPGGWKVARNAGFGPVGYEPYAHSMPNGFESMLLTGHWPQGSQRGEPDQKLPLAKHLHGIHKAVMGFAPPAVRSGLLPQAQERDTPILGADVDVCRADATGRLWFESRTDVFDRSAGIIGLSPLQGVDNCRGRFTHTYYVAKSPVSELGAAWVVFDRVDARARIMGLRAAAPSIRAALLRFLVRDLLGWADNGRLVIIVLVDSACFDAQATLVSLGFFPTAFLPAFISAPQGRRDVVQYTRLAGCSLLNSANSVTARVWPEAEAVISEVLHFACFEQACPRAADADPGLRGAA